ncbi:hypothetical protein L2E82_01326 [Cichorium intybus]|uniref:Uncharacterized protein n=1 Tax=Cichorium intybus TaxID=13427 RepID=A0ACB9GZ94_CICIN|nr:hypothetical protein L2E82_01326 [Cichorium intybus]
MLGFVNLVEGDDGCPSVCAMIKLSLLSCFAPMDRRRAASIRRESLEKKSREAVIRVVACCTMSNKAFRFIPLQLQSVRINLLKRRRLS